MNSSQFTVRDPAPPGEDGTLTAIVAAPSRKLEGGAILTLTGPSGLFQEQLAGRYFLARCGAASEWERTHDWNIYLRRPLFMVGRHPSPKSAFERWQVWAPIDSDPGYAWLRELPEGAAINLVGPFGNGFSILPTTRNLLLVTDQRRAPLLLPLIDRVLDRGGRVTVVMLGEGTSVDELTQGLPLAAEVRRAADDTEWQAMLTETLPWADQVCSSIGPNLVPGLANAVRKHRIRLEAGFGLILVEADLACGVGACLACVIQLANGSLTRACVHGPVFDLLELAGRT